MSDSLWGLKMKTNTLVLNWGNNPLKAVCCSKEIVQETTNQCSVFLPFPLNQQQSFSTSRSKLSSSPAFTACLALTCRAHLHTQTQYRFYCRIHFPLLPRSVSIVSCHIYIIYSLMHWLLLWWCWMKCAVAHGSAAACRLRAVQLMVQSHIHLFFSFFCGWIAVTVRKGGM